ncbi:MAG: hypothetical protein KAS49_07780 [Candidatus Cloacimonetes bacterium]|nr:hypothetical protein [Candidatus Cloacimonadota bacterium]
MKRTLIILFLTTLLLSSCDWKSKKTDKWTILIYMAADNSLSSNADEDIDEMAQADIPDNINVIVQIDRNEYNSDPDAKRYQISKNSKHPIDDLGEIDSGDPTVLTEFINWGSNKYPADKTAVIIWSHGNGWLQGYNKFCPDNQAGSSISIVEGELNMAMQNINITPEILAFDACNMLSVEVISEVAKHSKYILGSEDSIPADGFPYDEILPIFWEQLQTEQICEQIINYFVNSHMPYGSQNLYGDDRVMTGAVVKSSAFLQLEANLKTFCDKWIGNELDAFTEARGKIQIEFNDLSADIDLKDYFTRLRQASDNNALDEICTTILNNIETCFTSQYFHNSNFPYYNAGTATIWFPENHDTFEDLTPLYKQLHFTKNTGWDNFLAQLFSK